MKTLLALALLVLAAGAHAAPARPLDVCYVRPAAAAPAAAETATAPASASFVGLRRKTDKLFELDISVAGPENATCSLTGVARLHGPPGQEALAMVIRPEPGRKPRSGTLCQVFVYLTPTALELRTTPNACQAQGLCEGKVDLNGQRFEQASLQPSGGKGPCFGRAL